MMTAVIVLLAQTAWLVLGARCAAALTRDRDPHPVTSALAANIAAAFILVLGILLFWPLLFASAHVKDDRHDR